VIAVALDTHAYGEVKRGLADAAGIVRAAESIGISTIVIGELLAGFAAGARQRKNREDLEAFLRSPRVTVMPVDLGTADRYSEVWRTLRAMGRPIPTNDLWIAASALQHGHALFTRDAHFAHIVGLRLVTSPAELLG
jgi:tRNA(fMet)-specific endonuclease VapC